MPSCIKHFTLVFFIGLLAACDTGLNKSDYRGGFVTEQGSCPELGDLGITYRNQEIEIGFYCFLKECALVNGKASKTGFFHIEHNENYFVQGKMGAKEGSGKWFLNIKGQDCSGRWVALKND